MAGASGEQNKSILHQVLGLLQEMPEGVTPPEIGDKVHQVVREVTGVEDPYFEVKRLATEKAHSLLPRLKELVRNANNPLAAALRLSIAGNIIDFGPNPEYDLWEVVEQSLYEDFAIDDTPTLWEELSNAKSILFLADNAGETVFDGLFIEVLKKPVVYAVRGGPVLNDATAEDARAAGIDRIAEVVDNGARVPGTVLSRCSDAFIERFQKADLIISKGMGNYETLSEVRAPIYFLMQVKCPVIAKDVGAPVGRAIVKRQFIDCKAH